MQEWRHTQKPDQINEKARRGQGKIEKKTFFSLLYHQKKTTSNFVYIQFFLDLLMKVGMLDKKKVFNSKYLV